MRCKACKIHVLDLAKHCGLEAFARLERRCGNERLARQQAEAATEEFWVNGWLIKQVTEFWYLVRVLSDNSRDMACIQGKLTRAAKVKECWARSEAGRGKCAQWRSSTLVLSRPW